MEPRPRGIDDHSRLAITEVPPAETVPTSDALLRYAAIWYSACHIAVQELLTDSEGTLRYAPIAMAALILGIRQCFTKPQHRQIKQMVKRLPRTLLTDWGHDTANARSA